MIVVLTLILIRKLWQKSTWLKTANVGQEWSESLSNRDKNTMRMVVLISSILIACYIPAAFLCIGTFCHPEFSAVGQYSNLYYFLWAFATLFENINSSVNIFLYIKMSTKYKQTFWSFFLSVMSHVENNSDDIL